MDCPKGRPDDQGAMSPRTNSTFSKPRCFEKASNCTLFHKLVKVRLRCASLRLNRGLETVQ